MLNEIVKGMDNAAEKINENFSLLDFEINEDSNGGFKKFESGFLVTWKKVQARHGTVVNLPASYATTGYGISVIASDNQVTTGYNAKTVGGSSFAIRLYRGNNAITSSDTPIEVVVITVGIGT